MITNTYWPIVVAFVLVAFCGCSGQVSNQKAAIQHVIDKDSELAKKTYDGSAFSESSGGIRSYVDEAGAMEFSNCPPAFKLAYLRHLEAWSRTADALDSYQLKLWANAMSLSPTSPNLRENLDSAEKEIRDTWHVVEDLALEFGVTTR